MPLTSRLLVGLLTCCLGATQSARASEPNTAATKEKAAARAPISVSQQRANQRKAAKLFLTGAKQFDKQQITPAMDLFTQAHQLDPDNQQYIGALAAAQQFHVTELVQSATKARLMGDTASASALLLEAAKLDPDNLIVTQHMGELADGKIAKDTPKSSYAPPIALEPSGGTRSIHLHLPRPQLIRQVFSQFGIDVTTDTEMKSQLDRLDADDVDFAQAIHMLSLVTNTFYVPLDPHRALVAANTKQNREDLVRQSMETMYMAGLTTNEIADVGNIARNIYEIHQAITQPQLNTLTVRAPEPTLRALNSTVMGLMEGSHQVLINVRILEVSRNRTRDIGISLPQQTTLFNLPAELQTALSDNADLVNEIISSGLASAGDYATIAAILVASGSLSSSVLSEPFALFGGGLTESGLVPGSLTANFSLSSGENRMIDDVQLHASDQQVATFRSGTRYPIITSSYTDLASSSTSISGLTSSGTSSLLASLGISLSGSSTVTAIPQVQYQDLGLTLKATPHILTSGEINLLVDMKLQALTGSESNDIPVLSNRAYTGSITVRDGETAVIATNMNRQQSRAVSGLPGLSELPGFGSATDLDANYTYDELVITLTPYMTRKGHFGNGPAILVP